MTTKIRRPCEYAARIVLQGFAVPLPAGIGHVSNLPRDAQKEAGALWAGGAAAVTDLWRTHQIWLRRYAREHGIKPACSVHSRPAFFAEMIAAAGDAPVSRRTK
jgi:hypothetical protein